MTGIILWTVVGTSFFTATSATLFIFSTRAAFARKNRTTGARTVALTLLAEMIREGTWPVCGATVTWYHDRVANCVMPLAHSGPHATTLDELAHCGYTQPPF